MCSCPNFNFYDGTWISDYIPAIYVVMIIKPCPNINAALDNMS